MINRLLDKIDEEMKSVSDRLLDGMARDYTEYKVMTERIKVLAYIREMVKTMYVESED